MIVAIDGPAGSGKSTVAHAIADKCHLTYLDTGAMYRSVAAEAVRLGLDVSEVEKIAEVARTCTIEFGSDGSRQTVAVNGRDVTDEIRTPAIEAVVSPVSAIPAVREAMVVLQRKVGEAGNVVAEGRDIGTVVYPDAEVKVFLTADPSARAHRRAVQRSGGDCAVDASATASADEEAKILESLVSRDAADSTRATAPLKPAKDAVHIDSSTLTVAEVVDKIVSLSPELAAMAGGEAAPFAPAAEAKPEPRAEAKPEAKAAKKAEPGPMRAFAGNTLDDYYDHAMSEFPAPSRALLAFVVAVLRVFMRIHWPWRFEDGEKLLDDPRGRVIVMNHVSMIEPVITVIYLLSHGIGVRAIYKSEFDKVGIATWFFSRVGGIPVERGTADMRAVRRARAALMRGECVLIYPEGTRVKADDEPCEIHGGFSLMAHLAKAPVQPCAIVGARDVTPRGSHWHRPGRVFLKAGDPITFDELGCKGKKAQVAAMTDVAWNRVLELRSELRQEHPGKM